MVVLGGERVFMREVPLYAVPPARRKVTSTSVPGAGIGFLTTRILS